MQQLESANLPDSYADLKSLTLSLIEALKLKSLEVEALKFQLLQLRRWRFGAQSEKLDAEQLALWQAELESDIAAAERKLAEHAPQAKSQGVEKRVPKRAPLPEWLPRVEHRHEPTSCTCAQCGAQLVEIGEEISEQLDMIPAKFFVQRHIRPKLACRHCESLHSPGLPNQPIDKGLPAPGLLAQVLIAKYADHCPLHRQQGIYARMGVQLPRSTMAGWIGELEVSLEPLVAVLHGELLGERYLQADETTVPVLAPGTGRTATGYLWAYRSGPWSERQAVVFDFQPTRGRQWPQQFLYGFAGVLQVDGYAGYHEVFESGKVIEAGCAAHARRKFYEVHEQTKSPLAHYALLEFAKLYAIEAEAKELTSTERAALRRARAGPILGDFKPWLEQTLAHAPPRSALAQAIGYTLNRWTALLRYADDGMLNIDNNPVERTLRGVALGRKNYLFCGSNGGGHRAALIYSLIESAKLNHIDPYAYLVDILTRLPICRTKDLPALLPHRWQASQDAKADPPLAQQPAFA
jgi:transposase